MHFSREALKGIYEALSYAEREPLHERLNYPTGRIPDDMLPQVQQAMVDLGYIMPFVTPDTIEMGAREYDEIMKIQDLVGP